MRNTSKKVKSSAAGQYLGYSRQEVRLCYYLLCSEPDSYVSIEHLDDVCVENADGSILVEQIKSSVSGKNPISNYSLDLWKTFSNWITLIENDILNPETTTFTLYVIPENTGEWATILHNAKSSEDIARITAIIKEDMEKQSRVSCRTHLEKFLNTPEDNKLKILNNFVLYSEDSSIVDSLTKLLKPTLDESMIDFVIEAALGYARNKVDELISNKQPARILASDFQNKVRELVKKNNLENYLPPLSSKPTDIEITEVLSKRPKFIQQLEIISETDNDTFSRSVSDFLRTKADKIKWAEKGLIFPETTKEIDENLIQDYKNIKRKVTISHKSLTEEEQGGLIYSECALLKSKISLKDLPQYFVHGSYHNLANTLSIGWHPNYIKKLQSIEDTK